MDKDWIIAEGAPPQWQAQFPDVPAIVRQLLWNREVRDKDAVDKFLNPSYETDLHDPFLFKDMERVVERLFDAIEKKEKIFVYGDYDADGVPGAVIIKSTLDALGAVTDAYIPHREKEGYGLNSGAISYMRSAGGRVVITCDCGISNAAETDEAQSQGLNVIITDHHRIPEVVPKAYAILHPLIAGEQYPNKFLTGGGVAFKLAQALLRNQESGIMNQAEEGFSAQGGPASGWEKWLLDLVAISTVADVGKLLGENRTLVKYGLKVLNKTRRVGLQKLFDAAGIKAGALDTYSIGWQVAPRINAAGRMDHANAAFRLLVTEDAAEAEQLAQDLNRANQERQKVTDKALKEAREQIVKGTPSPQSSPIKGEEIGQSPSPPVGEGRGEGLPYLFAAYSPSWNAGIIGLVAGRLMDEFQRPVLIGTRNERGEIVCSARSISEFNIVEALAASREYILKFGGHPKAAGFSVADEKQWNALIAHLQELAREKLHALDIKPSLYIDADITLDQVNWDLVGALQNLEPFGEANPKPRFLLHGLEVLGASGVGNGGKHMRLTVTDERRRPQKMIGFNCGEWCARLAPGDLVDLVVEIGINEWNGEKEIELKIVDLRLHEAQSR